MTTPPALAIQPGGFGTVNVVETATSPSSAFTLSRFEFETGTKGNEGTKILMVEWDAAAAVDAQQNDASKKGDEAQQDENSSSSSSSNNNNNTKKKANIDDWEVKWEGKEALLVLPIRDADAPETTCRIYFLLPPKAPIPTLVTISPKTGSGSGGAGGPGDDASAPVGADLHTKPLPAIFPEGLVHEDKGVRGVLHTIWAKKRLGQLEAEMAAEMKTNGESVGLEMALQERQWIVEHFGLQIDTSSAEAIPLPPQSPGAASPASPRSPIGGRLGEKLKGLKLATSPAELAAAKQVANQNKSSSAAPRQVMAVVPESSGFQPRSMATGSATAGGAGAGAGGMASLSAVIQGGGGGPGVPGERDNKNTEEDLFALPMSPRSPEMAMSPFSLLKS